jgi:hypothetical protein
MHVGLKYEQMSLAYTPSLCTFRYYRNLPAQLFCNLGRAKDEWEKLISRQAGFYEKLCKRKIGHRCI